MTTSDEPPAGEAQSDRLKPALMRVAIYSAFIATLLFVLFPDSGLTIQLFRQQDYIALLMAAVPLGLIAWRRPLLNRPLTLPHRLLAPALALLVLPVAGAGTWLIFGNYPLSRDELLADFDSAFLAQLHLLGTIPPEWRPFSEALMPIFMLPISPESGWLSAYLPGNAALRAIGSRTSSARRRRWRRSAAWRPASRTISTT